MDISDLLPNDSLNFSEPLWGSPILEQLNTQRSYGKFCDIIFHVNGKELYAHRNVLAACSPYFASVLKMHKTIKEQLTVSCKNLEVFDSILSYIYSGTVTITELNVSEILRLSNHFLLSKLKHHCSEFLAKHLTITTCLNIKDIAERYSLTDLLKTSILFVRQNLKELLSSEELFSYPLYKLEPFLEDKNWSIPPFLLLTFIDQWILYNLPFREKELRTLLTYVNWKALEKSAIEEHMTNSKLYKNNPKSLFFLLESLENNSLLPEKQRNTYDELKSKYSNYLTEMDSESFVNIAIATALQEFKVSDNVDEPNPVALTPVEPTEIPAPPAPPPQKEIKGSSVTSATSSPGPPSQNSNEATEVTPKPLRKRGRPRKHPLPESKEESAVAVTPPPPPLQTTTPQPETPENNGTEANKPFLTSRGRKVEPPRRYHFEDKNQNLPKRSILRNSKAPKVEDQPTTVDPPTKVEEKVEIEENLQEETEDSKAAEDAIPPPLPEEMADGDDTEEGSDPELVTEENGKHKCPHCSFTTASGPTRLDQHMQKTHGKGMTYKCKLCDFTSQWNRDYYGHMKEVHFPGPPYKCDHCDYSHDWLHVMLIHRMKHTNERPHRCPHCAFSARTKPNLMAHLKLHTGLKPHHCDECGRAFTTKGSLDQHLAKHRIDRPYLCDTCGFSTKYQSHLMSHLRTHTGDVHFCTFPNCTYKSPKKSVLDAHMRIHTAVRSHVCSTCGRAFLEKSHLVRHERIHLSEKPFKCDKCDYGSTRRDKLKEHWQKHHSDQATARTPYKPRKPRRQNFSPLFLPGRTPSSTVNPLFHNFNESLYSSSQNFPEGNNFISIY